MVRTEFKKVCGLDEIVNNTNGIFVVSSNKNPNIKIRKLLKYCKENSKESSQLSENEIGKFYK